MSFAMDTFFLNFNIKPLIVSEESLGQVTRGKWDQTGNLKDKDCNRKKLYLF